MAFEASKDNEWDLSRVDGRFCGEPSLAEMLADPVVRAMMSVDGVAAEDIERLMLETRKRREVNNQLCLASAIGDRLQGRGCHVRTIQFLLAVVALALRAQGHPLTKIH